KGFREDFRGWRDSPDTYTISKNRSAPDRLVDATPMQLPNVGLNNSFAVDYNQGFGIQDASSRGARIGLSIGAIPFKLGELGLKLPVGAISGLAIGTY